MSAITVKRPWYRESWPWLLMLPPAASVVAGVALLYFAVREPPPLVVDDYARIEQISHDEAVADRSAVERGLAATLAVTDERGQTRIAVDLQGELDAPPASLALRLRHAGNAAADRALTLDYDGRTYTGHTEHLAAGRYDFELAPTGLAWRLAGAVGQAPTTVRVVAGD